MIWNAFDLFWVRWQQLKRTILFAQQTYSFQSSSTCRCSACRIRSQQSRIKRYVASLAWVRRPKKRKEILSVTRTNDWRKKSCAWLFFSNFSVENTLLFVCSLLIDLCTRVSNYFSKVESLLWISCLNDYLESLTQNKEISGDFLLIHFTRLQLIKNKIFRILGLQRVCQTISASRSSWSFYLKAMQTELKACRKIISSELQNDSKLNFDAALNYKIDVHVLELLLLHLYSTEGKVHEIAFLDPDTNHRELKLLRIESLYSVLEATKKWFEIYFTFSPVHYVRFSIWVSTQLARCIVLLYRLFTFDHPDWNQSLVRETCNLSTIINDVINNMTQVKSTTDLEYDDELSHM